jgi:hypothetical protein
MIAHSTYLTKLKKKALKRAHKKKGNKREPVREGQYFRREELIF